MKEEDNFEHFVQNYSTPSKDTLSSKQRIGNQIEFRMLELDSRNHYYSFYNINVYVTSGGQP